MCLQICRKLRDSDEQNRELMASVAKREEGLHQNNVSSAPFIDFQNRHEEFANEIFF